MIAWRGSKVVGELCVCVFVYMFVYDCVCVGDRFLL